MPETKPVVTWTGWKQTEVWKVFEKTMAKLTVVIPPFDPWSDYYSFEVESYRNRPEVPVLKAVDNTLFILTRIAKFLADKGVRLVVVGLPSKAIAFEEFSFVSGSETANGSRERALDVIRDKNGYSFANPSKQFQRICNQLDVPYYDLTQAMRSYPSSQLFGKVDRHWVAKGQEVAAKRLAELLRKDDYFK